MQLSLPLPHHDYRSVNYAISPVCDQNDHKGCSMCFHDPHLPCVWAVHSTNDMCSGYSPVASLRQSLLQSLDSEHRPLKVPRTLRSMSVPLPWDWAASTTTMSCRIPMRTAMPSA